MVTDPGRRFGGSTGVNFGFTSDLSEVSSFDGVGVGTLRWEKNLCYKYVKILNTTATVAGVANDPVAYTSEDGYSANEVCLDMSDADGKPILAGALVAAVTGTAGTAEYGWIQIKGPNTTTTAITGVDGDSLKMSTTDKTLVVGAAADDPIGAIANDVSARLIILDCPF